MVRKTIIIYRLLYTRFIDEEYIVTLPPKWFHEHTKRKINEKLSTVGKSWDELNKEFNPNNKARIELPRQESFIEQLITSTVYAYNIVMSDYTKTPVAVTVTAMMQQ